MSQSSYNGLNQLLLYKYLNFYLRKIFLGSLMGVQHEFFFPVEMSSTIKVKYSTSNSSTLNKFPISNETLSFDALLPLAKDIR